MPGKENLADLFSKPPCVRAWAASKGLTPMQSKKPCQQSEGTAVTVNAVSTRAQWRHESAAAPRWWQGQMQRNRQETRRARPCSRRSMQIRPVEQPLGEATLEHTVMPPKDKVELSPELARAAIPLTSLACEAEPPKTLIPLPKKGDLTTGCRRAI